MRERKLYPTKLFALLLILGAAIVFTLGSIVVAVSMVQPDRAAP